MTIHDPPTTPVEFSLRPAVRGDAAAIRRLIYSVRINPIHLNWKNFFLAVDNGDRMIGCGQIKRHGDGSAELASIAVTPAWRGRGVARAIIERLLVQAPNPLYLTCREELGPFYEKFGFRGAHHDELHPYFHRINRLADMLRRLRLAPDSGLLFMIRYRHTTDQTPALTPDASQTIPGF